MHQGVLPQRRNVIAVDERGCDLSKGRTSSRPCKSLKVSMSRIIIHVDDETLQDFISVPGLM
jgi:hypothetical protein